MSFYSCDNTSKQHELHEEDIPIIYNKDYRTIYINKCIDWDLSDSVLLLDVRHLVINCTSLNDYSKFFSQINTKEILTIRIDSLDQNALLLDLNGFYKLRQVSIFGTDKVNKIQLVGLSDDLRTLQLSAPNLSFPEFDSTLINLTSIYYNGRASIIPKWLENLKNLRKLIFNSNNLLQINSDVCKMGKLEVLGVVDLEEKNKEAVLRAMKVYPEIERIRQCKPNIIFWNILPPK